MPNLILLTLVWYLFPDLVVQLVEVHRRRNAMADRKAELERKKERLRQMREEKERRRKEKEKQVKIQKTLFTAAVSRLAWGLFLITYGSIIRESF